jgi:hypothetical protein
VIPGSQSQGLLPVDAANSSTLANTDVQASINAIKVTIKVSWSSNNATKELSTSEILTNWRPNY